MLIVSTERQQIDAFSGQMLDTERELNEISNLEYRYKISSQASYEVPGIDAAQTYSSSATARAMPGSGRISTTVGYF